MKSPAYYYNRYIEARLAKAGTVEEVRKLVTLYEPEDEENENFYTRTTNGTFGIAP